MQVYKYVYSNICIYIYRWTFRYDIGTKMIYENLLRRSQESIDLNSNIEMNEDEYEEIIEVNEKYEKKMKNLDKYTVFSSSLFGYGFGYIYAYEYVYVQIYLHL
jgi:hypothetical protein